mmetsp:Transcript_30272/g.48663  ORF Transcript_30272/g.48663 Transcript_30272/m.48663 type:complete len:87 (-) Transcript_30272:238-498(-)
MSNANRRLSAVQEVEARHPRPQAMASHPMLPLVSRTQPEACSKERADGSVRAAFTLWGKTQHLTSLCPVPLQPPEECGTLSFDLQI